MIAGGVTTRWPRPASLDEAAHEGVHHLDVEAAPDEGEVGDRLVAVAGQAGPGWR
jgi:hypothetical protein